MPDLSSLMQLLGGAGGGSPMGGGSRSPLPPDLAAMFGSAGIDLGNPSPAPQPPMGMGQPPMGGPMPEDTGATDQLAEQAVTGDVEAQILLALINGTPVAGPDGAPIADFSFIPPEFREQIRAAIETAVTALDAPPELPAEAPPPPMDVPPAPSAPPKKSAPKKTESDDDDKE